MKFHQKKGMRLLAGALAAALLCTGTGLLAYAAGAERGSQRKPEDAEEAGSTAKKDETVYVIADAEGAPQKVIVSDWIQNPQHLETLEDQSELKDIEVVKGESTYTLNGDNLKVWDTKGEDVYYQGIADQDLPVSVSVRYMLDGKAIGAQDLAGKSGHVTIRFDYKNLQSGKVQIQEQEETVYVPFVMLTGLVLDSSRFSHVTVTNGKCINDGEKLLVAGFALPGLQETLGLDPEKLELPAYVEISADVTDFALDTTMTLATAEMFQDLDLGGVNSLEGLEESMQDLTDAMAQLLDSSSALYDGLTELLDRSGLLIQGVDQLANGAARLASGAGDLSDGAAQMQQGLSQAQAGLGKLRSNSSVLNAGAQQVFDALLATADAQLKAAGLSAEKLTRDNYAKVLDGIAGSLDPTAVYDMAYNTALGQVSDAVRAQAPTVRARVEAAIRVRVLEGVLAEAGLDMTAEAYDAAVAAGAIDLETQAQISAGVEAQMQSEEIQAQIEQNTEAQIQALIDQTMKSPEIQAQINAAVESAKNGSGSIAALRAQLDSYSEFYQGLRSYTAGVDQAASGVDALAVGGKDLAAGAADLKSGANSLSRGLGNLRSGGGALTSGVQQLRDGAMQLSDGLQEFDEKGIQKLADAVEGDLDQLVLRLQAAVEAAQTYQTFAGLAEGMNGTVRFVYKTDGIGE